ncbi:hypothetical protein [Pontibacter populi]|uniref:Lipoprotein n=1 Tax=Pontibacter populi TaxID=890055 RepID=A0ABV1RTD9_9BACT
MIKNPLPLIILAFIVTFMAVSCDSGKRYQPEEQMPDEHIFRSEEYKREEALMKSKIRRGWEAVKDLSIVSSQTKYDSNFIPTVHLTIQNKSEKTIKAFTLKRKEDYSDFNKHFKVRLKPDQTYTTSIRVAEAEGLGEDIILQVDKIVYSDGSMVQVY